MKLTKPQMNELLDFINQVNRDDAYGTDSMRSSSFATTLGVSLMRALRYGTDVKGSAQGEVIHDEWQASAPRYDFSGK